MNIGKVTEIIRNELKSNKDGMTIMEIAEMYRIKPYIVHAILDTMVEAGELITDNESLSLDEEPVRATEE